jgi:predicted pyridoxine 5'-phosphate oxidase superfamily flavin-nucleotide-binding protein
MGHRYAEIMFTESVNQIQEQQGSLARYQRMQEGEKSNHLLGENEKLFIEARDSFYMASVSENGWPYVQHRGGPEGFMQVLDETTIGFADFIGNRQYISVGNLRKDDRVSLFFMDYASKLRLKVLGRVKLIDETQHELLAKLEVDDYRARVQRGFIITIEAFDWNCPQHITPRYTETQIEDRMTTLKTENEQLKLKIKQMEQQ